jgi:dTDP-4-dehydrorhamnose 3,5-epimerase
VKAPLVDERFELEPTPLDGLMVIHRKPIRDNRGFFSRLYCAAAFRAAGLDKSIAQINHTLTQKKGSVRGLHFQHPPHTEWKIVSCLRGEVFDVAVDIRKGSPTFLRWHGEILSARNQKSISIPEGFAHGFQTLSDNCELLYLHTAAYAPGAEDALHVADPMIGVAWPLAITDLSDRDRSHRFIDSDFEGISP